MTAPDPQTVREIAREYILNNRRPAYDLAPAILGRFGPDGLTRLEYRAYCDAVRKAIASAAVAVSWPDEQQPTAPVSGEQQDAAAEEVRRFLAALPPRIDLVADWTHSGVRNVLTAEACRAVLAERDALAARVAELESERVADLRVIATLVDDGGPTHPPHRWGAVLTEQFEERLRTVDLSYTEAGAVEES